MQVFRDLVKGWFGKGVLAVVILLFVLWGTEALFSLAARPKPAAIVEGNSISNELVLARAEQQKQFIMQQYRDQITANMIDDDLLKRSVLEGLINRHLLQSFVEESKMDVADSFVTQQIISDPTFHEDGKFSESLFDRKVKRYGLTGAGYLQELKLNIAIDRFETTLKKSAFVTAVEVDAVSDLQDQLRGFRYTTFKHNAFKDKVEVTEAEKQSFYKDNQQSYMEPEAVKVEYIEFKLDEDATQEIEITDTDIQKAYDNYVAELMLDEKRKAAHILIETQDRSDAEALALAEQALTRVKSGEDFSEVAKELSEDVGSKEEGGVLGLARKGDFLPEFETVMFALNSGQISEVVKTDYGYHVIKLLDIVNQEPTSLIEKRPELEKNLRESQAQEKFYLLEEEVAEIAFESENLEDLKQEFEKKAKTTDWITQTRGVGVFTDPKHLKTLFSEAVLMDRRNSGWIKIDDQRGVIARISEHRPQDVKPFETVKANIEQALKREKAAKEAASQAQKFIAKLRVGEDETVLKETFAVEWIDVEPADRRSSKASSDIMAEIFSMPKPTDTIPLVTKGLMQGSDYVVLQLKEVKQPVEVESDESAGNEVAVSSEKIDKVSEKTQDENQETETEAERKRKDKAQQQLTYLNQLVGDKAHAQILKWLESEADIERNL